MSISEISFNYLEIESHNTKEMKILNELFQK